MIVSWSNRLLPQSLREYRGEDEDKAEDEGEGRLLTSRGGPP